MNKKIVIMSFFMFLMHESIYCDNFGGGFATGALLGTGITLAATSGSRNPRDPYYDVDRARAQQELREIRAEDKLRREEERQERKRKQEEDRQAKKSHKDKNSKTQDKTPKKKVVKNQHDNSGENKNSTQSPEELQLEIKKLEREISQLKLDQKKKHSHM